MSAGLSPLRMRPERRCRDLTSQVFNARAVAHQPAGLRKCAVPIDRRQRMARRPCGELDAKVVEQHAGIDQECIDPFLRERREGRVDVAGCARGTTSNCPPIAEAAACSSATMDGTLELLESRSMANRAAPGRSSRKSPEPVVWGAPSAAISVKPDAAARLVEVRVTRPASDRPLPMLKTIGMVRSQLVAGRALRGGAGCPAWRSRPPGGEPDRPPAPAGDRCHSAPSGIRSRRCGPRYSRLRSGPCERPLPAPRSSPQPQPRDKPTNRIARARCCARAASGRADHVVALPRMPKTSSSPHEPSPTPETGIVAVYSSAF